MKLKKCYLKIENSEIKFGKSEVKSKNSHREHVKSKNNFKTFQYRDMSEKTTGIQMKYYPSERLLVLDVSFGHKHYPHFSSHSLMEHFR